MISVHVDGDAISFLCYGPCYRTNHYVIKVVYFTNNPMGNSAK